MQSKRVHIWVYLAVIAAAWGVVGLGHMSRKKGLVADFEAQIHNVAENHFLDQDAVADMARSIQGENPEDCTVDGLKLRGIEEGISSNPYVQSAESYTNLDGKVIVNLALRRPIARVFLDDGASFYLDQQFFKMDPSTRYSANTILIRGALNEPLFPRDTIRDSVLAGMKGLMRYIHDDEFLRSQISEIVVAESGDLTFYPEVGGTSILFGKAEEWESKFRKLRVFYSEIATKAGWDYYSSVDLKYKGQIVASKR